LHILSIRPEPPGAGNTLARFDAALSVGIRFFNLKLVRSRDGSLRVYAPSAYGTNTATFAPELAAALAVAAQSALGEKPVHDRHSV
jgi:glycerophosphoryl diester phosphodiesterase